MTEAAIISPVFFALLFGVIEMGILFRDHLTITNATRDGARTAAASGGDIDADWRILQTINQSAAAADRGDIQRIVIFKATSTSDKPTAACKTGPGVDGVCNVYTVADFARPVSDFTCGSWRARQAVLPGGPNLAARSALLARYAHERARLHRRVHRDATPLRHRVLRLQRHDPRHIRGANRTEDGDLDAAKSTSLN